MGRSFRFSIHALGRMFERHISEEDVEAVLDHGEVIESYTDDQPYPSQLLLGWRSGRPLHVVAALNASDNEVIVITAYQPNRAQWKADFRRRKL